MSRKGLILFIVAVLLTNLVQGGAWAFIITKQNQVREAEVASAQQMLDSIGPLTTCYTVATKPKAGQEVVYDTLVPMQVPESNFNESFITDPEKLKGKVFKVELTPGNPITSDVIMSDVVDDTARYLDIVPDTYPVGLKAGDYVDIRIMYPKGEDYIVCGKKRVAEVNGDTFKTALTEKEILMLSAARVDVAMNRYAGAYLYATKYVEPGVQKASKAYYNVPFSVQAVIAGNPNILEKAMTDSIDRTLLNTQLSGIDDTLAGRLQEETSSYLNKLQLAREELEERLQEEAAQSGADLDRDPVEDEGVVLDATTTEENNNLLDDNTME